MSYILDTNVVVSALIRPVSNPGRVLDLALAGAVPMVTCPQLLAEYYSVATRPKFGFDARVVRLLVDSIAGLSERVDPLPQRAVTSPDPNDQAIVDLAVQTGAVVVTGNVQHFKGIVPMMTPTQMLEELGRG